MNRLLLRHTWMAWYYLHEFEEGLSQSSTGN